MFGRFRNRGMFRRGLGRLARRTDFQTINQANRLMALGQYTQAAPLFAQLAQEAQAAGHPRQAANLLAQAALAGAASSDETIALMYARQALHELEQMGMLMRASGLMAMILIELKNHGLVNVGAQLQHEFAGQFDEAALAPAMKAQVPQQHRSLPAICPQCGGPVRSNEVEWIDAGSAECAYCGGVIAVL